jgi:thioredoxin 1
MSKIAHISSDAQLSKLLSSTKAVVVDFHAVWCGPCKAIAPTFQQLADQYASPGRIAFAKVDVDEVQEVAQKYGVSA